ncbi:hypothetical protein ROS1_55610 [Roseibium sp. ROS1]
MSGPDAIARFPDAFVQANALKGLLADCGLSKVRRRNSGAEAAPENMCHFNMP